MKMLKANWHHYNLIEKGTVRECGSFFMPFYEDEYTAICSTPSGSIDFLRKYYDEFILDDNVFGRVNVHRKEINL